MTEQQKTILELTDQIITASKALKEHSRLDYHDSQVFSQIHKKTQLIASKIIMGGASQEVCQS